MKSQISRRTLLKQGAASSVSLLVLSGCAPGRGETAAKDRLDPSLLRSLAEAVLPSELEAEGRERVVTGFEGWVAGYEPVPELMHSYGSQEIRYGPGDPAPRWSSQLAAMDLESRKRWNQSFMELGVERRRQMVRDALAGADLQRLPNPSRADHPGVAILAYWLGLPEATNLCYRRIINPRTCRPLAASPDRPAPMDSREA